MNNICYNKESNELFKILSIDKGSDRIVVEDANGFVTIALTQEAFNKKFYMQDECPVVKCQCGAHATFGREIPASWHSATMPCHTNYLV